MNFNVDFNKVIEQYGIKLSQLTKENIILNVALNEMQNELTELKEQQNKENE